MRPSDWRRYISVLAAILVFESISFLVFGHGLLAAATFWVVLVIAVIGGWRRPIWLVYATMAELVIGGKGHLLSVHLGGFDLSIRLGLFIILAFIAVVKWWPDRRLTWPRPVSWSLLCLIAWITVAAGIGFVRGNGLAHVFYDVNAFLYLGTFFFWWVLLRRQPNWRQDVLVIILAGTTDVALKTWGISVLFTHGYGDVARTYHWIRDTGIGEITAITPGVYRVFFQSQVYAMLAFILTLAGFVWKRAPRWWWIPMLLSAYGMYISLSRSFWVGSAAAIGVIGLLGLRQIGWRSIGRWWILLPMAAVVWLLSSWATNFPAVWQLRGGGTSVILARLASEGSQEAADARRNQIQPLLNSIKRQPIIGRGFGTNVTYYSTDPRVRGWRTTDAFELGYLDLWLKFGLIGLGLYGWWLYTILRRLSATPWLPLMLGGMVALVVTHTFSPYLNHPLGLGWLVLTSLFAYAPD